MNGLVNFSLLAPEGAEKNFFRLDSTAFNDLSLEFLTGFTAEHDMEISVLEDIIFDMPTDRRTIAYRQEIYKDLRNHPDICMEFYEIFDEMKFCSMNERRTAEKHSSIWQLLNRFSMMQNYVNSVTRLQKILKDASFESEGMKNLGRYIENIYSESGFEELSKDLAVLADDSNGIYSMTLGVNFNEDFYPEEVGIISLNRYAFQEKGVLEKFFNFHRKKNPSDSDLNPYSMYTHPKRAGGEESPLMNNLTCIVEQMLPQQVKKLEKVLKKYTDVSASSLARCADELLFYYRMAGLEKKLNEAGLATCIPQISEGDTEFHGLYSIRLAACAVNKTAEENIVCNDLYFADGKDILLLTGPNRGGKTIITQAAGLAFLLFQHGVFVPCSSASVRICDGIFTHFPADENQTVELGRLGEEAERFSRICEAATSDSIILMNESFSTTSHTESLYIAEDAVRYLCAAGTRTFFNTHMHELAENAEKYRGETGKSEAVSVVMGRRDTADAFKIKYVKPDGKSFAREIAEKYGITFEQLSAKLKNKS